MNDNIKRQDCWWEREKTPWSGTLFDGFALKEDSYREKRIQMLRDEIVEGNGIKAIRFRLELIKGEVHVENSPTYTLVVSA